MSNWWPSRLATTPDETVEPSQPQGTSTDPSATRPTLQEAREQARPLRAVTRHHRSESTNHLTPAARIRNISRSRSPSPASPTTSSTRFNFPSLPTAARMDEQTQKLIADAVEFALNKDRAERDKQTKIVTEAAVAAALAHQTSHVRSLRKPDLPNLDKRHIESWIKRVEHAFTRAEVNRPKDKFSFLESKFAGCEDATINEFLEKDSQDAWEQFLDYLRDLYGKTKKDRVHTIFNGVPRESRRPKQLAAHIRDLVGSITLDDVLRELMLKEIPQDVRRLAATAIEDLDFQETADYLDKFFDKQGRVLNASNTTSNVNSVKSQQQQQPQRSSMKQNDPVSTTSSTAPDQSFTSAFGEEDDSGDVNAVRFRPDGQRQSFSIANRSQSRSRGQQGGSSNNSSSSSNTRSFERRGRSGSRYGSSSSSQSNSNNSSTRDQSSTRSQSKVCSFHVQYGDQARSCRPGCMLYAKHQSKGQASS